MAESSCSTAFANTEVTVAAVPLLTESERHKIVVEWNRTERKYPRNQCIHQLFEEQAERTPEAIAVVFDGNSLSYGELNTRSSQLARHLRSLGVGPDVLVGLWVERSLEMVVALLGILKAGGAYVPLDATIPVTRLQGILQMAQIKLLLTQSTLASRLGTNSVRTLLLDQPLNASPGHDFPSAVESHHLCYVIFTLGSTGVPKGVQVEHRGLVNLAVWHKSAYGLERGERVTQLANLSFDAAWEIWPALSAGASVFIVDEGTRMNPKKLAGWLARQQISVCFMPTSLAIAALQEEWPAGGRLRYLLTGGDWLTARPRDGFPFRLVNHYGPTEATILATSGIVTAHRSASSESPSIGRPIANVTVYILDQNLSVLPPGFTGELCIGGDGVARGYLNAPELNAEKFIPNPFSAEPGARLYKTGDMARWLPDGEIEFLGRQDHQVKLWGYRIELGEIETALGALPEVQQAVVIVRQDLPGGQRMAAYLVAQTPEKPDDLTLRARLAEKLPEYMLPGSFVWLDQMPLTANGKVDRQALPAPEASGGLTDPSPSPTSVLEWELIRIWRRLFQRQDIGRHDNFFALGGHSLMAARLAAEIDTLLGGKTPVAALFQCPTIELLVRRFANERWSLTWSSLVPLQPQGTQRPVYFVHGVGGDVFGFVKLAELLGPDQPCYGIQAVGLDGKSPRHITVEDMAAHYVREIISFQTEGPFYLAGYSMGGVIAFEIAQQLHRLGRRVALLALLDCSPVGTTPWFYYGLAMATYIPGRCRLHWQHWLKLPRREKTRYFQGRLTSLRNLVVENFTKPTLVTAPPPLDTQPPKLSLEIDYYHAAALPYQLRAYPGSADLFVSDEAVSGWSWYWRHLARGGVSFHRIPGRHLEIFSPDNLPELAKSLADVLKRKQREE